MNYDVIIIGAGPGGIFSAYELSNMQPTWKIAVFESGNELKKRRCPIDGEKVKSCINCKSCSIMSGFGGAGAYSDGKFNITTEFGGWLGTYTGDQELMDLINYVDSVNLNFGATEEITDPYTPKVKEIVIPRPERKVKRRQLFTFLDEEKEGE